MTLCEERMWTSILKRARFVVYDSDDTEPET